MSILGRKKFSEVKFIGQFWFGLGENLGLKLAHKCPMNFNQEIKEEEKNSQKDEFIQT